MARKGTGKRRGTVGRHRPEVVASWLARRQEHGWTWPELARRSSIPVSTLQWWKHRLEAEVEAVPVAPDGGHSLSFVEAALVSGESAASAPGQCLIEFRSGHRMVVEEGFPTEALRALAELLVRE